MKTTVVREMDRPFIFREYEFMRQFISDQTVPGLEIGAAAHNPYWSALVNCQNVAPDDAEDFEVYKSAQVDLCGSYVEVDILAEGDDLPLEDESQGYIISSHSLEHFPNPIKALEEWNRVLRVDGVVVLVVPFRNALPADAERPLSVIDQIIDAYERGVTVDTFEPTEWDTYPVTRRGHYYVYNAELVKQIVERACPNWVLIGEEDRDSKVGNGFALVYAKRAIESSPIPDAPQPKAGRPRKKK